MTVATAWFRTITNTRLDDKFVTLPTGLRVRYVEYGPSDGPVLLLTHGFLRSLQDWRLNIKILSEDSVPPRRIIAFDWPGFGLSDKGDLEYSLYFYADFLWDFVKALGLSQFDMLSHSMGGKYTLAFMALHPGLVRKLILVDTDAFIKDPWWSAHTTKSWFQSFSASQFKLFGKPRFLKFFARQVFKDKTFVPDPEALQQEAQALGSPAQLEAVAAMNYHYPKLSMRLTGLIDRMSEINTPTLIIWGRQDKIVNVKYAQETHKLLKNSQLYIYEKCGHLPFVEYREDFNRLTLDFLDR
jgi:pimeloyl-ACP methyl ester carboxylesterase